MDTNNYTSIYTRDVLSIICYVQDLSTYIRIYLHLYV